MACCTCVFLIYPQWLNRLSAGANIGYPSKCHKMEICNIIVSCENNKEKTSNLFQEIGSGKRTLDICASYDVINPTAKHDIKGIATRLFFHWNKNLANACSSALI